MLGFVALHLEERRPSTSIISNTYGAGQCANCRRWVWNEARARFMPPLVAEALPAALLERFGGAGLAPQLLATLRFLAPLPEGR